MPTNVYPPVAATATSEEFPAWTALGNISAALTISGNDAEPAWTALGNIGATITISSD